MLPMCNVWGNVEYEGCQLQHDRARVDRLCRGHVAGKQLPKRAGIWWTTTRRLSGRLSAAGVPGRIPTVSTRRLWWSAAGKESFHGISEGGAAVLCFLYH